MILFGVISVILLLGMIGGRDKDEKKCFTIAFCVCIIITAVMKIMNLQ
ncbi:MAG: hypothetical protein PHY47_16110 [Lachnospiraceae bacterium]|nr:hypothetical protein [Lachnospiraceae bacterium]